MNLKRVSSSIRTQFLIVMFLLIVVPVILGAIVTYYYFGSYIKKMQAQELETVRDDKYSEIQLYFNSQRQTLGLISHSAIVRDFLSKVSQTAQSTNFTPNALEKQFKKEFSRLDLFLGGFGDLPLYLIEGKTGLISYQTIPHPDQGSKLFSGKLSSSFLAGFVQRIISERSLAMSDFMYYPPLDKKVSFLGEPVFDRNGKALGVVLIEQTSETIARILKPHSLLARKTQIFITNAAGELMALNTAGMSRPVGNLRFNLDQGQKRNGTFYGKDFNGEKALASVITLHFPGTNIDWRLVAQMDESALSGPFNSLRIYLFLIVVLLSFTGLLVVFWLSRLVSSPIEVINYTLTQVSEGNLKVEVPQFDYGNELDELSYNLQKMVERLHTQIYDVQQHINNISSSSTEISATISQITASSSETASAITETASSSEEVSQLARSFDEKAKDALQSSNDTIDASENSKEAINAIYQVIGQVKTQIDEVANSMVSLSKQSQTISEITTAVQEIAEQSNILAINASIEATKAGEYGRGFAVVANEVRNLAEQSKKATQQIRSILDAIQESISRSVMQVEQTNKIVNEGSVHMAQVNKAVEVLSNSIDHLIHLVSEVAESSHEQLKGSAQIKEAMENIKEATSQNLDGMRQMEEVIAGLKKTAEYLKDMVSIYKL